MERFGGGGERAALVPYEQEPAAHIRASDRNAAKESGALFRFDGFR
jgi:hypothetical protein